ncbi:CaiB/BaiF CoA-transferase family protein [Terasakiella sp. SH-1]|uniref:CaiB/BaiF CoA transferase family protein n=1 Tax=Terasakiella sp. SH-1 TaxID=2560057 RepID=UPI0010732EDE|nr:CaiB/BaiF CoA-transferase family protein [Terasakiella sp. SH-1]
MSANTHLPLKGLNVVAIEQAVAAPYCSARLADAGASVIKIERPEGDFARGYDDAASGQSSYFVWLNRGKKSVIVDLASAEGKASLRDLLENADVLLQNLKPGALERLGFGFEELRKTHPGLIICSISGYGETGPMVNRKAYDLLIQAEAGLCSLTGNADAPARVGISIVDIATGAVAYSAILEALLARGISGEGANISVSMFDVMADWLTVPLMQYEGTGKLPPRIGMAHPSIAPYGVFKTKDDQLILIAIQSDREWVILCKDFLHNESAATDPQFNTNVARVKNREATDVLVRTAFANIDIAEARNLLDKSKIAYASVNDMDGLSNHPHLRKVEVETPNGPVSYPAPAPVFTNQTRSYGSVPALGADNSILNKGE